jgi:hypothetical protein
MDTHDSNKKDIVDIEEFARAGKPVPATRRYRIRIDKENYETSAQTLTGTQILDLAKKTPDKYLLYLHTRGGQTRAIGAVDTVDLTEPGVERFSTMKIENSEGK